MRLFNTLSQRIEQVEFPDGIVRLYVCGITPYDTSHLGHARVGIVYDTLRRYLEYLGCDVQYVQNITDIDDPLFERAKRDNVAWDELAARETERYLQALTRVNVPRPRYYVRASEVLDIMQQVIQRLLDGGYAYVADGAVYYDIRAFPRFGEIFHADYATMLATANERGNNPDAPGKRDPLDFVLWQPSQPGEPSWPSPWGAGRPGWHIECSTIATHYLGPQLDIHGGGADLIFPHHAAEIAQAEPANGVTPFVRCWMHVGMVYKAGEKMSKSLGNMVFVDDLLTHHSPDAVRLSVLRFRYRDEYSYDEVELEREEGLAEQFHAAAHVASTGDGALLDAMSYRARFLDALADDFDTPRATAVLSELAQSILDAAEQSRDVSDAQALLRELADVLGLTLSTPA